MRIYTGLSALSIACSLAFVATPAFAGDGSSLLGLLPSSSKVVVGVDVDALRSAPIFAQAAALVTGTAEYRAALADLGGAIDPMTSVHTFVMAAPTLDSAELDDRAVVLIEATFDAGSLDTTLTANAELTRATSGTVITFTEGERMVAILGPNLLAAGHTELVTAVVATHGGGDGGLGSTLRSPARSAAGGTIWFASRAPSTETRFSTIRGRISVSSSMSATVTATTESPEAATALVTEFNTELGLVTSNPQLMAFGLGPVLSGMSATASENDATVTANIDAATWTSLSTMAIEILRSEM
jgi:hypothetical protein